jgi:hypothetical protein
MGFMLEALTIKAINFFNFIKPRNKLGVVSFVILSAFLLSGILVFIAPTHAAGGLFDLTANAIIQGFASIILALCTMFIQLAIFFLKFTIEVSAYNNYINSQPVLLGWTLVRDIANMFFVVILLVIAFATVLGLENYSWKKLLMKFVLMAILVNFSRIICGVVIDAAQVFMMTFVNALSATAGGNLIGALKLDKMLSFSKGMKPEELNLSKVVATLMAASFFSVLAAFTVLAYLLMLLTRVIVLWVLIILSPLAFVLNVVPKTQAYASKWWTTFGNEVVSGPVLVFFLWLSFAVAGSGSLHDEINNNSGPYSLSGATEQINKEVAAQEIGTEPTAGGLGQIFEWSEMAGFIIAISMLLVGVKTAKELSTVGGGVMGSVVDFGKKAAMMASGVAAGRYLAVGAAKGVGKGVVGGAKLVAMKMPLGGEYWQNKGMAAKGWATQKKANLDDARNAWAEKRESKGWLGRRAASVIQSGARARQRAKDWEETGEYAKQAMEKRMSTSSTAGGQAKMGERGKLNQAEDLSSKKQVEKVAQAKIDLLAGSSRAREIEQRIVESAVKGEQLREQTEGSQQAKISQIRAERALGTDEKALEFQARQEQASKFGAVRKIADLTSESAKTIAERNAMEAYTAVGTPGSQAAGDMVRKKAEAEHRITESDFDTAENIARAKDEYLSGITHVKGDAYFREAQAKRTKVNIDRMSVGTLDRAKAQAANLGASVASGNMAQVQKAGADIMLSNFQRGSVFALETMDQFFTNSKLTRHDVAAETDEQNIVAQQANLMTSLLGEQVDNDKAKVVIAFNSLQKLKGEAYMEELSKALGTVGEDASNTFAGLMKEKRDPHTGDVKVGLLDYSIKDDRDSIVGKREYAMTQSKLGNKGLAGSVDHFGDKIRIKSEQAKKNIGQMFESVTSNNFQRVDKNAINDLADALINATNQAEIDAVNEILRDKINKHDGYVAMIKGIQNAITNKGKSIVLNELPMRNKTSSITPPAGGGGSGSGGGGGTTGRHANPGANTP